MSQMFNVVLMFGSESRLRSRSRVRMLELLVSAFHARRSWSLASEWSDGPRLGNSEASCGGLRRVGCTDTFRTTSRQAREESYH